MTWTRSGKAMLSQSDGFTIVEMLVGLSITALISGLLATALVQFRPMRALTETSEAESELASATRYLEGLIGEARGVTLLSENPDRRIVFSGNQQNMRFTAIARVGSERSSLREVALSVHQAGEGLELIQTNTPRRPFISPSSEEFVIVANLKSARFQYLGRQAGEQSAQWLDQWSDEQALPRAIKLTLVSKRFGHDVTDEQIVMPHSAE